MNRNTLNASATVNPLKEKGKRNSSLDFIRMLAFSSVVYIHFFLHIGFYEMELVGWAGFVMTVARSLGSVCVPLFLLLTGYLMKGKQLNGKYYGGIKNTLITYFYVSIISYIYNCRHDGVPMGFGDFFKNVAEFSAAKYSWYIEMYIGLFLLIPFLNIIWNNLPSKKHRLALIGTMAFLIAAPETLNYFVFGVDGWWLQPSVSHAITRIVPDWWAGIYPIMYYFLGCYIREYGIKINKKLNLVLVGGWALIYGSYCYYRSTPLSFVKGGWQNYGSLFVVVLSVLVFVFILNLNIKLKSHRVQNFTRTTSESCLAAYLVSYVVDQLIYTRFNEMVTNPFARFKYIILIVPLSIVISLLCAFVINKAVELTTKGILGLSALIRKGCSSIKREKTANKELVVTQPDEAEQVIENPEIIDVEVKISL